MANLGYLTIAQIKNANTSRSGKRFTIVMDDKTIGVLHPNVRQSLIEEGYTSIAVDMDMATPLPDNGQSSDFDKSLDIGNAIDYSKSRQMSVKDYAEMNKHKASLKLVDRVQQHLVAADVAKELGLSADIINQYI